MNAPSPLGTLILHVALLALFAIGGANVVIPELHRMAVETNGWMGDTTFADLFAIAQVTPGPNVILVTLIGWYVAGVPGAVLSTLVMCVPAGVAALGLAQLSRRFQDARPRIAIQRGLAALTIGIVPASGYILARAGDDNAVAAVLTVATALAAVKLKANPLWFIAVGAACGALGLV